MTQAVRVTEESNESTGGLMATRGTRGNNPNEASAIKRDDRLLDRASNGDRTSDRTVNLLGDLRRETDKDTPKG